MVFAEVFFSAGKKLFVAYTKKSLKASGWGFVAILYDKLYEGIFFPRACFDYRHYLHFIHSHTFPKNLLMHSRKKIHFRDSSTSLEVWLDKNFSIEFYHALR